MCGQTIHPFLAEAMRSTLDNAMVRERILETHASAAEDAESQIDVPEETYVVITGLLGMSDPGKNFSLVKRRFRKFLDVIEASIIELCGLDGSVDGKTRALNPLPESMALQKVS